jgi:glycosyltransferase involved in cell wall biosynthesis
MGMRILFIVATQVEQGSYWRAYHFGRQLSRRGHSVSLLATAPQARAGIRTRCEAGLTLVESPDLFRGSLRSGWDPWNTLHRLWWVGQAGFDLVHAIEGRPTVIYPALYLQRRGVSLVMDWCDWFGRGGSVEERPNPVVRAVLRPVETYFEEHFRPRADGNLVISSTLQHKALALGVPASRLRLLPVGADPELWQDIPKEEARRQTRLPMDAFFIGYVGSIFQRDARLMAQSFEAVKTRLPNSRLLVTGYCPTDLRRLVKHPEAVSQTGPLPIHELNMHLAACDIFWLPLSDSNANRGRFPIKLRDYMAIGRPTVATAVGDVLELFNEEPIGLLCAPEPQSMADQTMRLANDPDLRNQMGRRARQLAETRFHWATLTTQLEAFYQEIQRIKMP